MTYKWCINTCINNYSTLFSKTEEKAVGHHPFTCFLTSPNITLHPLYVLTRGIPLPILHQSGCAWGLAYRPGISESKTLHIRSCLPAFPLLTSLQVWGMTKLQKQENLGISFLQVFGKKAQQDEIRRNSSGFAQHLIKTAIFVEGSVWLRI